MKNIKVKSNLINLLQVKNLIINKLFDLFDFLVFNNNKFFKFYLMNLIIYNNIFFIKQGLSMQLKHPDQQ